MSQNVKLHNNKNFRRSILLTMKTKQELTAQIAALLNEVFSTSARMCYCIYYSKSKDIQSKKGFECLYFL